MLKKRNLIFLSLLILGVLLLSSCFLNPPVTEGILKGQVMVPEGTTQAKDLTGQALPDATVNIIDLSTGAIIATTITDANGYYQVFVPAGGPYLLEAVKGSVRLEQITCQVEIGIEYNLGTTDCVSTTTALIAQAMMDAGANPTDIDCAVIIADSNFDDVSSIVCSTIQAGGDPTVSAAIEQAVEDFLNPTTPVPTPTPVAVTGIAVKAAPTKVTYTAGETLDLAGLVVTLSKSFGADQDVAFVDFTTAGITTVKANGVALVVADTQVVITHTASGKTANQAITVNAATLAIGDSYGGGVVAYIFVEEDDGYVEGETHGLIAATVDQSAGIQWYNNDSFTTTGATGTVLGTGSANTTTIITSQGATATDYAAGLARAYRGGDYVDWFLPSKDELNKLWLNKAAIGGFAGCYWSSSEFSDEKAYYQDFLNGGKNPTFKNQNYGVRAVRAF